MALFAMLLASSAVAQTTLVDPGNHLESANIACGGHDGVVDVHTGEQIRFDDRPVDSRKFIGLMYTGTNCNDCRWYQFTWDEIIVSDRSGHVGPIGGSFETTSGTQTLTTDSTHPNWNVDSASPNDPSYEAEGAHTRTPNSDSMYDAPDSGLDTAPAQAAKADPNNTQVTSLIHYVSYLNCNHTVCAKLTWSVRHVWTRSSGAVFGPEYTVLPWDASGTMPDSSQMQAFDQRYPGRSF